MPSSDTPFNVAIIGGGLAGLTAACYLARRGADVTLFEQAPSLGGRAATQRFGGYRLNRGIHALYCGGAASSVLADLGITYTGKPPRTIHALRRGTFHLAPIGTPSLLTTDLLSLADKVELMRLFSRMSRLNSADFRDVSVRQWLDTNTRRPRVNQLMTANAWTFVYSSALDLVSAEVFILKMQLGLRHPVIYIDGGWETLVQGLRTVAERAGARIRTGAHVSALDCSDGRVQAVTLRDGSAIRTDAVIVATSARGAVSLVGPPLQRVVDPLVPAQVASLDVALRRLPNSRWTVVQDLEQPRFMSIQSLYSRVAPEGGAVIYAFKQLDPRHSGDPHSDERDLEDLLDVAQPGWREVVEHRQYLPRIEAVGMLPMASTHGYAGRPGVRVPGVSNLYVAGDWVGEGFLSDPSFGSAREVARLIQAADSAP
jgi:phytoene dehydrogenase-like protein